jgi:membrane-associated phospholipid phosphatase
VFVDGIRALFAPVTGAYSHVDYMFSGHTIALTALYLSCLHIPRTPRMPVTMLYGSCLLLLVLCRVHYTVDILVGLLASLFCHMVYDAHYRDYMD